MHSLVSISRLGLPSYYGSWAFICFGGGRSVCFSYLMDQVILWQGLLAISQYDTLSQRPPPETEDSITYQV